MCFTMSVEGISQIDLALKLFFSIAFSLLIYFSFDLLFHLEWMYKREFSGVICRFQIPCSLQREFQNNKTFFITVKKKIYIYISAYILA